MDEDEELDGAELPSGTVDDYLRTAFGVTPDSQAPPAGAGAAQDDEDDHEAEEDDDAVLERLMASEGQGARGGSDDDEPEDDDDEGQEGLQEAEGAERQAAEGRDDEGERYAEAIAVLTRSGWTPQDILSLDREIAVATAAALGGSMGADAQSVEGPSGRAEQGAPDWSSLRESLSDDLTEEAAANLVGILERQSAASSDRIAQLEASTNWLRQQLLEQMTQAARSRLLDRFPGLGDDDGYARVRERMGVLARSGEYADIDTLLEHAARIEVPEAKKADRGRKRRGQMTPPGRPSRGGKAEDPDDAVLRMLEDPKYAGNPLAVRKAIFGR